MKLCQNMSEEDKAILVQLARRHTLAEARRVGDIEANRKRMSRAKSLEGFDNDLEENLEDEPSGIRSHLSGAPSVVITESELVSSQLYKDRKAKINSDDESIDNPKSDDPDNYEPRRLHDPIYKERIVIPVTEIPISSDMKPLVLKENVPHTADEKEQNPKYSDISIPNKHLADDSSIDVTKIITTKQDTSKSFEQKQIVLEANAKEEFSNNPNSNASHKEVLANNTTNLVELNRNEILKQNPAEMDSQKEHSVNHIGIVEQDPQAKNISELDSENHNNSDSSQLMLLHPVVESKAIPVPVEFLRRLGFDIKNAEDNKPLSAKDMEIKFSLAEALKYLRSLDTENRLPTSRKKINQNVIKQNASKNPEPVDEAERKEYLKKLRIKLFEEEN
ncbi:UNVERIFIED_CONTAM: hypothetical protein NCL1_19466 [Trichonephila clavipes]